MIKLQFLLVGVALSLIICSFVEAPSISQTRQLPDTPNISYSSYAHPSETVVSANSANISLAYFVIVFMENKNYGDIINNIAAAPYINHLASDKAIVANYFDVSNNLSLPNYLGPTTGQTYNSWSSCNKPPSSCAGYTPIMGPTITDEIESAGLTWKAYMENMPSNCYQNDFGQYVARHDPFVYFSKVQNNETECNRVVPASANDSNLVQDLGSTSSASNLMWLTPNLCDDMHNCTISIGDTYLSHIVPEILNSYIFHTHNAALFITWDEGSNSAHIPAIWAGASVKNDYTSKVTYNHYSFLKTIETAWHLPSLTSNDAGASAMTDVFQSPQSNFTYIPANPQVRQKVTFVSAVTGGFSPYVHSWSFGDGTQASGSTVNHDYANPGSYDVVFSTKDSFNQASYTAQTIFVSSAEAKPNSTKTPIVNNRVPTENQQAFLVWLVSPTPMSLVTGSASVTVLLGSLSASRKKR